MILEAGADDLLTVVKILWANEADDGVDEEGLVFAGDRIGARLDGLLIDAVKTRSIGAPRLMASIEVVTWVRTQLWVGISKRAMISSIMRTRSMIAPTLSLAGLMPITASPQPYMRPSTMEAAMPRLSSVG
jgi:hypothetical protein